MTDARTPEQQLRARQRLALAADIYIVSHHGKKDGVAARLDIARRLPRDLGCGHKEPAAPDSIPVTVQTAATATGAVGGAYSANIVADTQVDVAFKVNGYVQSILQMKGADGKPRNVQAGDSVTSGHRARRRQG